MSWLSTSWEREGKLWKPFSVSPHFQAIFFGGKLDDIECEPVQSLANKNYSQRSVYETLFHAVCLVVFNEYPDHFIFYVIISIINLIEVISLVSGPWLYSKTLLRHEVSVKAANVSGYMNIFDSERKVEMQTLKADWGVSRRAPIKLSADQLIGNMLYLQC